MKIMFKDGDAWELSVEELKELLINNLDAKIKPVNNSNKPSIDCEPYRPIKKDIKHIKGTTRKLLDETIRRIKDMALNNKTDKEIAESLNISPQLVRYWRLNTPKDWHE
jgi:hypothetical protein